MRENQIKARIHPYLLVLILQVRYGTVRYLPYPAYKINHVQTWVLFTEILPTDSNVNSIGWYRYLPTNLWITGTVCPDLDWRHLFYSYLCNCLHPEFRHLSKRSYQNTHRTNFVWKNSLFFKRRHKERVSRNLRPSFSSNSFFWSHKMVLKDDLLF